MALFKLHKRLNKKGQGLAFAAVLVLVIILYFIFKYHSDVYEFTMTAGEDRAVMMSSFAEVEKAKIFVQDALREAGYATLWNLNRTNASDAFKQAQAACMGEFQNNVSALFKAYLDKYEATHPALYTVLPNYKVEVTSCSWSDGSGKIEISAYGFYEGCEINLSKYSYPAYPCEFRDSEEDCKAVPFSNNTPGACTWNGTNCNQKISEPDCESRTENNCADEYCYWKESYGENINVVHFENEDRIYMLNAISNAHVDVVLTTSGADAYYSREKLPWCNLHIQEETQDSQKISWLVLQYRDNLAPNKDSTIIYINSESYPLNKFTEVDPNDNQYIDGKEYKYNITGKQVNSANATVIDQNGYPGICTL